MQACILFTASPPSPKKFAAITALCQLYELEQSQMLSDDQMLSNASEVWLGGEKLRRGGSAGKRAARSDRGGTHKKARRSIPSHLTEVDVAEIDAGLAEANTALAGDVSEAKSLASAENRGPGLDLDS